MDLIGKLLGITLVSLFASGCGLLKKAKIEDHEWCIDLGTYGAECFNILSEKERALDSVEWYNERIGPKFGQVCGSPDAYNNLKTTVEQVCSQTKLCSVEEKQKINRISNIVKKAQKKLEK